MEVMVQNNVARFYYSLCTVYYAFITARSVMTQYVVRPSVCL